MSKFELLDTRAFDKFISEKSNLIARYRKLNLEYDNIIKDLLAEWKGHGAEAFEADAKNVKSNIAGIEEILKIMCDMLEDCRDVYAECDTALGDANRNTMT